MKDYAINKTIKNKGGNKILKYNHREKSLKAPFIFIADLECILSKNKFASK